MREENDSGSIKGVKVSKNMQVTHIMFVDNLLFGGTNNNDDWKIIHHIIRKFSNASSLYMGTNRSLLIIEDINDPRCREICNLFWISLRKFWKRASNIFVSN